MLSGGMTLPSDTPSATAPPKRGARWVFVGPHGLRAGWGILLFLLLLGAAQFAIVMALSAMGLSSDDLHADPQSALGTITVLAPGVAAVILATLGIALIERRPGRDYGLGLKGFWVRFGLGLAVGVGLLALLVGALAALGALKFDAGMLQGGEAWRQGALWAVACLMIGLVEELVMRGYLLAKLTRSIGFRWAAIITSLLFAAAHLTNTGESIVGLVSVLLVGLVLAYSVARTGSLWWAVGFHGAWNWGQSYLFGVGDSGFQSKGTLLTSHPAGPAWLSGGTTGPEGSVLVILVLALAGVIVWRLPASPEASQD